MDKRPQKTTDDRSLSIDVLRTIIEDSDRTSSERVSAIKELRILTQGEEGSGDQPGQMSRVELQSELRRCRALMGG